MKRIKIARYEFPSQQKILVIDLSSESEKENIKSFFKHLFSVTYPEAKVVFIWRKENHWEWETAAAYVLHNAIADINLDTLSYTEISLP